MAKYIRGAAQGRVALQVFAAATAIWWMLFWFLNGLTKGQNWLDKISNKVNSKFLGTSGTVFMLQILPVVVLSIVGFFALELRRRIKPTLKWQADGKSEKPSVNIWTMPIIVRSPIGMLTLGDIIFILAVLFTVLWFFLKWTVKEMQDIDAGPVRPGGPAKWLHKVHLVGVMFGDVSLIPLTLIWIPVSRGSPILNVTGVPFERAVKYHIWLGLLTMWLLIAHGIVLIFYFIERHKLNTEGLFEWYTRGVAVLPGIIALTAGIFMLATAVERVRRKSFDLFFTVHHLYLVFLHFFAFHCAWCIDYMIVPILLFFLDRFMRMVQSRKSVDVLLAKVHRSSAIELTFAKPARSTYHALSFVYVRLPSVSRLQWHPFSVASSPLDGTNKIVIYIKPLGDFTRNLHDILISSKQTKDSGREVFKCPFSFKVGLEGPYGSESMFYLRYKSLVMIAAGIGVTPFLAILRDILHRYRLQEEGLPSSIELILCVKYASELQILDTLAPNSIFPGYGDHLKIMVRAYVTQQDDLQTSIGSTSVASLPRAPVNSGSAKELKNMNPEAPVDDLILYSSSIKSLREMSAISSTGNTMWVATTVFSALASYFVIFGLFSLKVPNTENSGPVRVMLYMVSITLSVAVVGGGVMLLWAYTDKRARKSDAEVRSQLSRTSSPLHGMPEDNKDMEIAADGVVECLWQENVTYGRRPNWKEMFAEFATNNKGQDVGVMASGGLQLQEDIATECKHHSLPWNSTVVFHYHSVSFDL